MKLKQVLFGIVVCYLCVNAVYTAFPLIITFARIPTTIPFYGSIISSLIEYRMVKMTFIHMAFDLFLIIFGIRCCMKQNGGTRFSAFALIAAAVNFNSNLIWTFLGYIFSIQ